MAKNLSDFVLSAKKHTKNGRAENILEPSGPTGPGHPMMYGPELSDARRRLEAAFDGEWERDPSYYDLAQRSERNAQPGQRATEGRGAAEQEICWPGAKSLPASEGWGILKEKRKRSRRQRMRARRVKAEIRNPEGPKGRKKS